MRRTIVLRDDDVLVVGGYKVDGCVLREMLTGDRRLLWAFVKNGDDLRPVPYGEDRVIWLEESDLVRTETDT